MTRESEGAATAPGPARGAGEAAAVRVEIDDRQRRHAVDRARVRRAARRAHDLGGGRGGVISILLASDRRLRALNRSFRGIDRATDVLSFPAGGRGRGAGRHLGDVAISVETAARQARASGWRLPQVIDRLVAHGVLHLLGWDHEADRGQMMTLQGRVLRSLRRPGRR